MSCTVAGCLLTSWRLVQLGLLVERVGWFIFSRWIKHEEESNTVFIVVLPLHLKTSPETVICFIYTTFGWNSKSNISVCLCLRICPSFWNNLVLFHRKHWEHLTTADFKRKAEFLNTFLCTRRYQNIFLLTFLWWTDKEFAVNA